MQNLRGRDFLKGRFGIHYTPIFKTICKNNTNAGLLLSQMCYFADITENYFYKFSKPCENRFYQNGDSWCELLCFSEGELRLAMSILKELEFITSKRSENMDGRTYYSVNFENIAEAITSILNNTLTNEQKQPLKAKTEPKEYKDTTEQEKQLKTQKNATIAKNATSDLKPKEKKPVFDMRSVELPNFINPQVWLRYCDYKAERKEKLTQTGIQAKFSEWKKWHDEGVNINECIETAMANEWRGVFRPKGNFKNNENQITMDEINANFNLGYDEPSPFDTSEIKALREMRKQMQRITNE